jgi:hypothetical protein
MGGRKTGSVGTVFLMAYPELRLVNPYFIIYNKYNGVMRIFLYTTTQFISPSSYIQDGISIISSNSSSMLNFLGQDLIDATTTKQSYSEVLAAPNDGSFPLATNKWYMIQYEMAYDPNITNIPYQNIQLNWNMNYYNINEISLGGEIVGTVKGAIGSSSGNNIFSSLAQVGKTVGTGVLAGIGNDFFKNNTVNENTGENKIGLPSKVFKSILSGVSSAISGSAKDLPGAVFNVLSSILKGGSNGTTLVNLKLDANIILNGSGKEAGSFPSSPTSFWVPGTDIPSNAVGYIPYYNKTLGILNFTAKPTVEVSEGQYALFYSDGSGNVTPSSFTFPKIDFTQYLIFNPEVQKIADIQIRKQELLLLANSDNFYREDQGTFERLEKWGKNNFDCFVNPTYISAGGYDMASENFDLGVRFTIDVKPKNGAPISTITKTFKLNKKITNTFLEYWDYFY